MKLSCLLPVAGLVEQAGSMLKEARMTADNTSFWKAIFIGVVSWCFKRDIIGKPEEDVQQKADDGPKGFAMAKF